MNRFNNEKWLMMGATSGLGLSFLTKINKEHQEIHTKSISRKTNPSFDFTHEEGWDVLLFFIANWNPDRIFYFSGGGPFGEYPDKNWKDHQWAFRLNFLFPARLIHFLSTLESDFKQLILIGSSIAENQPDPFAASYAAAKHGLRGLVHSIQLENSLKYDLRLFSPGYMDTQMLPPKAKPRVNSPHLISTPQQVAESLYRLILEPLK